MRWARRARRRRSARRLGGLGDLARRRQRVQTRMRRTVPLMIAFTGWRFGSNRRGPTLWAWETVRPTIGPLSQISQRLAMIPRSVPEPARETRLHRPRKLQIVAARLGLPDSAQGMMSPRRLGGRAPSRPRPGSPVGAAPSARDSRWVGRA